MHLIPGTAIQLNVTCRDIGRLCRNSAGDGMGGPKTRSMSMSCICLCESENWCIYPRRARLVLLSLIVRPWLAMGLECVGISLLISANDERIAVALQAQAVNQCMRRPLWSAKLIPYTWYLHLY